MLGEIFSVLRNTPQPLTLAHALPSKKRSKPEDLSGTGRAQRKVSRKTV